MIESYFFIPGNHPRLSDKLATIKADNLIIDLEDAVSKVEVFPALNKLKAIESKGKIWIRPILFETDHQQSAAFKKLVQFGYRKFVIPKIRTVDQLNSLEALIDRSIINDLSLIILVENPECLLNLNKIIVASLFKIEGIGFGSQDYCTETGMKHTFDFLKIPRFLIMNTAKAHGIKCIDIACMDAQAGGIFKHELKEAFNMGFDGKFLIHPAQLEVLEQFPFYTKDEILEAEAILNEYEHLNHPAVFIYKSRAIEPPHIKYFRKIIEWRNKYATQ